MHFSTRTARVGAGLTMLAALAFTACSTDTASDTDDAALAATDTEENMVMSQAKRGLIVEDISQDMPVEDTLRPEHHEIITPAGTLTIDAVEVIDTVLAGDINMEDIDPAATVQAADGEVFRVLNMSFSPDADAPETEAALAFYVAGQQHHIADLEEQQDYRVLVSVAEAERTHLVVSSEGHDQLASLLSGERFIEEDDAAAGYYRNGAEQSINHDFQIADDAVLVQGQGGAGNQEEALIHYDFGLNDARLTAWTPDDGWAAPGEAWLALDWDYNVSTDPILSSVEIDITDISMVLTADLGNKTEEDTTLDAGGHGGSSDDITTVFAVPLDVQDVSFSVAGQINVGLDNLSFAIAADQQTHYDYETEVVDVSFPADDATATTETAPTEEPTD